VFGSSYGAEIAATRSSPTLDWPGDMAPRLERVAALLALRNVDVVVSGTKRR
jgi:hypothetical protein